MTERTSCPAFFLFLIFLFVSVAGYCQRPAGDSTFLAQALRNARSVYANSIGNQANLYNGVEYKGFYIQNNDEGNPFFVSDDWVEGTIVYDGEEYDHVPMMYDLVNDKVIVEQPYNNFKLELISEKIKSFSLSGHSFVRLVEKSKGDSSVRTGFYDVLYDGKVKVYARRQIDRKKTTETGELKYAYLPMDRFFIYKNGFFFSAKSKSSVLRIFADRKKAVRKYISKSRIFKGERDLALAAVARFYDQPEAQP